MAGSCVLDSAVVDIQVAGFAAASWLWRWKSKVVDLVQQYGGYGYGSKAEFEKKKSTPSQN